MKHNYIVPEMEIVEMALETIVAESTAVMGVNDSKGEENEDFAREHRGAWGNLWE